MQFFLKIFKNEIEKQTMENTQKYLFKKKAKKVEQMCT